MDGVMKSSLLWWGKRSPGWDTGTIFDSARVDFGSALANGISGRCGRNPRACPRSAAF